MNNVNVICDDCGQHFVITAVKDIELNVKDEQIILTYFMCPTCEKIYCVCIKNEEIKELEIDLDKANKRYKRNMRCRNLETIQVLLNSFIRKKERIKAKTEKLMDKYPGTFTFVRSENDNEEIIINYHE